MGIRLERDRRAGLLPDSVAFWFNPIDGRTTPLAANRAWLLLRVAQHVVVDLDLMRAMGRAVPLTLVPPVEAGQHRVLTRRAPKAAAVMPSRSKAKASGDARLYVGRANVA